MMEPTMYTGESMPTELLAIICEYLARKDLVCFRLEDDATRQEAFEEEWKAYRCIIDSTSSIKAAKYDYFALAKALHNFQNLECVNVNSEGPDSHSVFHEHFSAKGIYFKIPASADMQRDARARALRNIMFAVCLAGIKLNSLTSTLIPLNYFTRTFDRFHQFTIKVAQHLKHMDITLVPHFWGEHPPRVIARMRNFFSSAVNLEKLRVALDSDYFYAYTIPTITWDCILASLKLPKLKFFELCNISGTHEHLSNFLKDHTSTLRHLYLGDLRLDENVSRWEHVFTTMQSLPLRTCQLRGYWGGRYESENINMFVIMMNNRKDGLEPPCLSTLVEVLIKDALEHPELSTLLLSRLCEIMMYQMKYLYDKRSESNASADEPDPSAVFDADEVRDSSTSRGTVNQKIWDAWSIPENKMEPEGKLDDASDLDSVRPGTD